MDLNERKIWGLTKCLIDTPYYSKHELEVESGGFSSFHFHEYRMNRFSVECGEIRVVWSFAWKIYSVDITTGMCFEMSSLVPHQFQVLSSGRLFEEYIPDRKGTVQNSDITRLTKGGMIKDIDHIRDTVGIIKEDGTFWEGAE